MGHIDELSRVDGGWQAILAGFEANPAARGAAEHGAFGHPRQRRLGLRVPANCWALLTGHTTNAYAIAVELSSTGAVLKFVGRRSLPRFLLDQRFALDLFIPGAATPVHVIVRPVRTIGDLQAFEFIQSSAVDRLTLAEHLDRLMGNDPLRNAVRLARRRAS